MTTEDSRDRGLDEIIDQALRFIKPVLKVKNGTGVMGVDSLRLFLKTAIQQKIAQEANKAQQQLLAELLASLATPAYPEDMDYVAMVKKASEHGKYDDMYENGFKAAVEIIKHKQQATLQNKTNDGGTE